MVSNSKSSPCQNILTTNQTLIIQSHQKYYWCPRYAKLCFFPILRYNIGLFSIDPCKVIDLELFSLSICIITLVSYCFLQLSLFFNLRVDSDKFSVNFCYLLKKEKERLLLLQQQLKERQIFEKQYRKEALNQRTKLIQKLSKEVKSDNYCYRKVRRVKTLLGNINKSPKLLSQFQEHQSYFCRMQILDKYLIFHKKVKIKRFFHKT